MADQFLSKGNTDVLWEVLADDDTVPKTKETQETFVWLLPRFHAKYSKPGIDLMDLNKNFIREMILEVKKQKTVTNSPVTKQLMTSEDIRNQRMTDFQKDLKKAENDFQYSMARPVPEEPNFKDNLEDPPLGNVSAEIEKMMRERNLDLSNIQQKQDPKKAEKWLSSNNFDLDTTTGFKTIKIDNDELGMKVQSVNLEIEEKEAVDSKHVSWNDEVIDISQSKDLSNDDTNNISIFSKLKPVEQVKETIKQQNQSHEIYKLYEYITQRFDKLEKMIEERGLSKDVMDNDSDNSELGEINNSDLYKE
jgi:hypothetical protein